MDKLKFALLMLVAVAALAFGETLISRGMKQAGADSPGFWTVARQAVGNPWVVSGVALLVLHLALYAAALSLADLSLVMPITAASYPLGALMARFYLHEEVNLARWIGTAVITVGVAVVAWGEARTGP
jgi:drug/metabolite transporter (DMT)-like permease